MNAAAPAQSDAHISGDHSILSPQLSGTFVGFQLPVPLHTPSTPIFHSMVCGNALRGRPTAATKSVA